MSIAEKLTQIAENEQKVYDAGYSAGQACGGGYDEFWDSYQENGNRANCDYMFAGQGWNDETFKPKYNIKPTTSAGNLFTGTTITDLVARLEECGVELDLSECAEGNYFINGSKTITTFPTADIRKRSRATTTKYMWYNCPNLRVIEKVILKEDGTQEFDTYSFGALPALEEIRFEGVIGQNGLNFSASTNLSHDSLMSILHALKDYAGSGTSYKATLGATNLAKLTDTEKAIATDKGWTLE